MNNKQRLEELLSREKKDFQNLKDDQPFNNFICYLRRRNRIPKDGFKLNKDFQKWQKNIKKLDSQFFKKDYYYFMNQLNRKKLDRSNSKDLEVIERAELYIRSITPSCKLELEIAELVKVYNLAPRFNHYIYEYLIFNDPDKIQYEAGPLVTKSSDGNINISIHENTTLPDIKAIWSHVKEKQSELPYRKRKKMYPIPNIEKYRKAFILSKKHLLHREIADIVGEGVLVLGETDARDYVKRFKKILGKSKN